MMIAIAILFLVYELSFDIISALLYLGFMIEPLEPTLKNGLKNFFCKSSYFSVYIREYKSSAKDAEMILIISRFYFAEVKDNVIFY